MTSWKLIDEIGIEYIQSAKEGAGDCLQSPIYAEKSGDGEYLIVDELCREKALGENVQCRTLLVTRDKKILFDSAQHGIQDGYGCLLADASIALLVRMRWEVKIFGKDGNVIKTIDLWRFSKRLPRTISYTNEGTFIISFLNKVKEYDIVEVDGQGRLTWYLRHDDNVFAYPSCPRLQKDGNLLIADMAKHVAMELNKDGSIVWNMGVPNDPAKYMDRLSGPGSLRMDNKGNRIIADTNNHRIIFIKPNQPVELKKLKGGDFCEPAYADYLDNGNFLICDTGNRRVVELTEDGTATWQYGKTVGINRIFSFPRSVDASVDGALIVADTANDRILEINRNRVSEWPQEEEYGLFWPRCARVLVSGSLLVADGRNSRVIELTRQGKITKELNAVSINGLTELKDPHDVRLLMNGNLLIADSSNDMVIETDWTGKVHWSTGENSVHLKDPHSAQMIDDGRVLITDSGNNRILLIDKEADNTIQSLDVSSNSCCYRLSSPKYAELTEYDSILVVDSGNNRILAVDCSGTLLWELTDVPESSIPYLKFPRWVRQTAKDTIVISDLYNHRILRLQMS